MPTPGLFSIAIASYNNGAYIEQMLDSVRQQTYSAIELVIVDDCSTDNSAEVIANWLCRTGYPATYVQHEKNQGIVRTFSDCRALATGEFLSPVGSDDLLTPDMAAATVAEFARQGLDCAAVYADCRVIDAQGQETAPSFMGLFNPTYAAHPPQGNLTLPLLRGLYLPALTTTMRRSAIDAVGEYDLTLFAEDLDMWLRLSRHFRIAHLPRSLGAYRVHNASAIHANRLSLNETFFRIYRKGNFEGEVEWTAARHKLAEHAEHYYASAGPETLARLRYAWHETRSPKLALFWTLARLGIGYGVIKRLRDAKAR